MIEKTAQRGSLLVAAVVLIAVIAVLASTLSFLFVGSSTSSSDHLSAAKALFAAEAGLEQAAYLYANGTTCNSISATNIAVGGGTFSITASQYTATATMNRVAGITSNATTIPVNTLTGFAPHGRVRMASLILPEEVNYSGTGSGATQCPLGSPCLTGAKRGMDGTTPATQGFNTSVRQHQCLVRSTGTVLNTQRVVERALQKHSEFFDGPSVALTNAAVNLNGTPGTLPSGNNLVIAVVSLNNTGNIITIGAGNMVLLNSSTGAVLASNQYAVIVGGGTPDNNIFDQKTLFFVARDFNAAANAAYNVRVTSNTLNTGAGEVKMLTFNGVAASGYAAGGGVGPIVAGTLAPLLSYTATGLPAGENVVIAAVQMQNPNAGNNDASVGPGDLQLCRGAAPCAASLLDSNALRIDVRASANNPNNPNNSIGVLLMARDTNAGASQLYTVALRPTSNSLNGQARILVLSGVTSRIASGTATLGIFPPTLIANLSTDLLDGTNLVIDTTQFENTDTQGNPIDILAGNEMMTYAAAPVSSNQYNRNLCAQSQQGGGGNSSERCNDFFSALLWRNSTVAAPSYQVAAFPSAPALVSAAAKIMALQAPRGIVDWQEIFP